MTAALGRGGDPRLLLDELLHIIRETIRTWPRSLQVEMGPSDLGHPCDRWMSHKLRGTPEVNSRHTPWLPTIGTAIHAWLQDAFIRDQFAAVRAGQPPRWLLEERVTVGTVSGVEISGSCDLYDTLTATVVDWKTCGKTRLDKYRRHGPDPDYRVQAHAYGRGWQRRGYPIDTVAIAFLPRNAELDQTVWWSEPYDEKVAVAALARAEVIGMTNIALGKAAPAAMATTNHNCGYCGYFQLNATDLAISCPGDPARPKPNDSIRSLMA